MPKRGLVLAPTARFFPDGRVKPRWRLDDLGGPPPWRLAGSPPLQSHPSKVPSRWAADVQGRPPLWGVKLDAALMFAIVDEYDVDASKVRAHLLFFDKLALPMAYPPLAAPRPVIHELVSAGVLEIRALEMAGTLAVDGQPVDKAFAYGRQGGTLTALRGDHETAWAIERGDRPPGIKVDAFTQDQGLLLSLYDCLPVPDVSVPISDVLEFRERRRAEQQALRETLETLYLETLRDEPTRPLAEARAVEKVQRAVADVLRVVQERGFHYRIARSLSFKPEGAINPIGAAAAGAVAFAGGGGAAALATVAAQLLGGLAPTLKLNWSTVLKGGDASPYEYAVSVRKELAWPANASIYDRKRRPGRRPRKRGAA